MQFTLQGWARRREEGGGGWWGGGMKEGGDEEARGLDKRFQMASPPALSLKRWCCGHCGLESGHPLFLARCSQRARAPPHRRSAWEKPAWSLFPRSAAWHSRGAPGLSPTARPAKPSIEYLPGPLDIGALEISSISCICRMDSFGPQTHVLDSLAPCPPNLIILGSSAERTLSEAHFAGRISVVRGWNEGPCVGC